MIRRLAWWGLLISPMMLTGLTALWFATQSPFLSPTVEKTTEQLRAELTRLMADEVTLAWLLPRVQEALIAEDLVQLELLLGLSNDHGIVLPRDLVEDIAELDAARSGPFARAAACGACAVDIASCETLAQIGSCALPFELTPAGDLNALRRAGADYIDGVGIDRLDVGLALIGLGATGAVLASGGSSYGIKAGTSLLRMARKLGTLTPALARRLSVLVGDAVRWDAMGDFARLRVGPQALVDSTKLAELADLGGSLRRVAGNTSVAETVSLMRLVESSEDAARLARISEAMGPRTRGAFEVLGKARVFRAAVRVSDLAIGAAAAIYAFALSVLLGAGQLCGAACLRLIRRRLY